MGAGSPRAPSSATPRRAASGRARTTTAPPGAPSTQVLGTLACGGAWGSNVQTSALFTNIGTLGEPTPSAVGGAVEETSSKFINYGGFEAMAH
jgi:hypothetical protein